MVIPTYNLFVYGSLRSGFRNPAYQYLTQYFTYKGEALVKGNFYDAGNHPVAVPSDTDNFLIGELYSLNNIEEFSWAFEQLDDYEGVNVEPGETPLYTRAKAEVYQNGESQMAYIYWYNKTITGFSKIETGDVLKYIQQKICHNNKTISTILTIFNFFKRYNAATKKYLFFIRFSFRCTKCS